MHLRAHYTAELEQLRLQVELMAVSIEENLDRMRAALESADAHQGTEPPAVVAARVDRSVDAMNVSLTERCYELIAREQPVASDLRLIVSVIRMLNELERISDHAVLVCQQVAEEPEIAEDRALRRLLVALADEVVDRFHLARLGWGSMDIEVADRLADGSPRIEVLHRRLIRELLALDGPDAVGTALRASAIGRSLERIGDHVTIMGARLRYLITGDPAHLAAEIR